MATKSNALGLTCLTDTSSTLKTVAPAFARSVRKNIRSGVSNAGAVVTTRIKQNAEQQGLHQAANAVTISTRLNPKGASVRVQVDKNKARYARPMELGNKVAFNENLVSAAESALNKGRKTSFAGVSRRKAIAEAKRRFGGAAVSGQLLRYPVYHKPGDPGGYAVVPTRPFFFPAIKASEGDIGLDMEKAIIQAARDAGFK